MLSQPSIIALPVASDLIKEGIYGQKPRFYSKFREFAIKGNMIDLAVGVIIGGAFGKIIDSLVKDLVMPLISFILGGEVDFSNKLLVLREPEVIPVPTQLRR